MARLLVKVVNVSSHLNIRSGPGISFKDVGSINNGTEVVTTQIQNGFYKLENGKGWISDDYVKVLQNLDEPTPPTNVNNAPKPQTPVASVPPGGFPESEDLSAYDVDPTNALKGKTYGQYDYEDFKINQNDEGFPPVIGTQSNGLKIYNYYMDMGAQQGNLKKVRSNLSMIGEADKYKDISSNLFHRFNRFKMPFPDYHLSKTFAHVFITRPDLNLFEDDGGSHPQLLSHVNNEPTFYYLNKNNPDVLRSLTRDFSSEHDFHTFLSNAAQSFEVSDEYIKTMEHGETITGYKMMYGKNNIESKTAGNFSISYTDDKDLTIYKTHKAWIDYISKVYRGEFPTKPEYIRSKILDYCSSVYYFLVGPDGESLLFWTKYFGVFPTNAPSSIASWSKGGMVNLPEFSINYNYAFKEDFSPLSLAEFNINSRGGLVYKEIYEKRNRSVGKTMAGAPFIETKEDGAGGYRFRLKYRV